MGDIFERKKMKEAIVLLFEHRETGRTWYQPGIFHDEDGSLTLAWLKHDVTEEPTLTWLNTIRPSDEIILRQAEDRVIPFVLKSKKKALKLAKREILRIGGDEKTRFDSIFKMSGEMER